MSTQGEPVHSWGVSIQTPYDKKAAQAVISTAVGFLVFTALSLTEIAMGILYMAKCSCEESIPVYLVAEGIATIICLVFIGLTGTIKFCSRPGHIEKKPLLPIQTTTTRLMMSVCCILFYLFASVWFIAGNIWVFGIRHRVQFEQDHLLSYCEPTLYTFAIVSVITRWMLMITASIIAIVHALRNINMIKTIVDPSDAGSELSLDVIKDFKSPS